VYDLDAARDAVDVGSSVVAMATRHVLASGGDRLDPSRTPVGQMVVYDLAHGAAAVEIARSVIGYGAHGEVEARIPASALGAPPAFSLAFASEELLLVPTFGSEARDGGAATGDALFRVSLAGDAPESLVRSAEPFMLGEVRCAADCGTCFVADAERGLLRRFTVRGGLVHAAEEVHIDDGLDAPPRYLGSL